VKQECIDLINESLDMREFDQIVNKADSIPNPSVRLDTIIGIAKKVSKFDVEKALYAIRRVPVYRYSIAQAEIAYELAKNGDIATSSVILGCIIDDDIKQMAIENINTL